MIRLQRVTFLALHDYLGLTTELTRSNDDPLPVQSTRRTHINPRQHPKPAHPQNLVHSKSLSLDQHTAKATEASTTTSTDTLNRIDDDFNSDAYARSARASYSTSNLSYGGPPSSRSRITTIPDVEDNEIDALETASITDRSIPLSASGAKRSVSFLGQRSMSVVESRHMKPDFEEAAARARVKNSLDTTFFEKHKISYPNVSHNRLSNPSASRRRSSFSDVRFRSNNLLLNRTSLW